MTTTASIEAFGQALTFYRTEQGDLVCPVCAIAYPGSSDMSPLIYLTSGHLCTECKTNAYLDDVSRTPPGRSISVTWDMLRIRWLDRNAWEAAKVARVIERLHLTREQLESDRLQLSQTRNFRTIDGI